MHGFASAEQNILLHLSLFLIAGESNAIWEGGSMAWPGPWLRSARDQLNSRFHGRDIFREIGLLP